MLTLAVQSSRQDESCTVQSEGKTKRAKRVTFTTTSPKTGLLFIGTNRSKPFQQFDLEYEANSRTTVHATTKNPMVQQ